MGLRSDSAWETDPLWRPGTACWSLCPSYATAVRRHAALGTPSGSFCVARRGRWDVRGCEKGLVRPPDRSALDGAGPGGGLTPSANCCRWRTLGVKHDIALSAFRQRHRRTVARAPTWPGGQSGQSLLARRDGGCLAPGPMTDRGRSTENPPADAPDEADAEPPTEISNQTVRSRIAVPTRT